MIQNEIKIIFFDDCMFKNFKIENNYLSFIRVALCIYLFIAYNLLAPGIENEQISRNFYSNDNLLIGFFSKCVESVESFSLTLKNPLMVFWLKRCVRQSFIVDLMIRGYM